MGFYFRKSLRLGPLRFNLSKRGVGASVGVNGARVGVDASGREYIAGGRGGIYFRERGRVGWIIVGAAVAIAVLFLLAAGCASASRVPSRRRSVPSSPTPAPTEAPLPNVPQPYLDHGQQAPGARAR